MLKASELKTIKRYLDQLEDAKVSFPHSKTLAVYLISDVPFAYLETGKQLYRLSVRTDPILGKLLKDKYEEVTDGQKLNPKIWITIVISGQLSLNELTALIDHSYQLAKSTI